MRGHWGQCCGGGFAAGELGRSLLDAPTLDGACVYL